MAGTRTTSYVPDALHTEQTSHHYSHIVVTRNLDGHGVFCSHTADSGLAHTWRSSSVTRKITRQLPVKNRPTCVITLAAGLHHSVFPDISTSAHLRVSLDHRFRIVILVSEILYHTASVLPKLFLNSGHFLKHISSVKLATRCLPASASDSHLSVIFRAL